jgi:hypothetical protein
MQQVNVAYEGQDLLRLLELQLKLEQIDADHASEVAEDRLRHYNTILDQQVKELDAELDQVELPWRMELDLPPSAHLSPTRVLEQIHEDSEGLRRQDETLRGDLAKFQDVAQLKKWLKSPGARRRDDDLELDLFR